MKKMKHHILYWITQRDTKRNSYRKKAKRKKTRAKTPTLDEGKWQETIKYPHLANNNGLCAQA